MLRRRCRLAGVRIRYLIVVNLLSGRSAYQTAGVLGVHNTTVYRVARRFKGFRRDEEGHLEATLDLERPSGKIGKLRRLLIGQPIHSELEVHERLTKKKALAVFSSDALSSVAYAPQETLIVLLAAGAAAAWWSLPIAFAVVALLAIVVTSYRQTIYTYPSGGGSYIVASQNLGVIPGLTAAASLMTDYVLTVAVSTAAGVAAITSLVPELLPYTTELVSSCANVIGCALTGTSSAPVGSPAMNTHGSASDSTSTHAIGGPPSPYSTLQEV